MHLGAHAGLRPFLGPADDIVHVAPQAHSAVWPLQQHTAGHQPLCKPCRGLLIRGGDVLETASHLDTIVFDKTGTLTMGNPSVTRVSPSAGSSWSAADVLMHAAAVERHTTHPIAAAVVKAADAAGAAACPGCHCLHFEGRLPAC